MKIAIDCRLINESGIGTYIREIVYHLIKNSLYDRLSLVGSEDILRHFISDISAKLTNENIRIIHCDFKPFSFKEICFFIPKEVNKYDVFFTPNFNVLRGIKIPIISTIHDVVFWDIKEVVSPMGRFIRYLFLLRCIKKSREIITVSNFSKKRIETLLGINKRINVINNGISHYVLYRKDEIIQHSRTYNFNYIVFVGNFKKHKNLKLLVDAYAKAKAQNFLLRLVIIGQKEGLKTIDTDTLNLINQIHTDIILTGKVSNELLYSIIYNANALIQPSLYEGFGIPPLEAYALGTQVILSDIPVFKELYGDYPFIFFQNNNEIDLTNALLRISNTKRIVAVKQELLEKYSFNDSALKLYGLLQKIVKDN